ncbi:Fe-S cluster assembly protein SufD [candidate division KSB1 bacterium]|nr:Fe-S cluster assembly protein SufD [candidate division KSB1 bacterium]RQW03341.1 MAG: Fe-S cluster assembly protein SufD [candidate division KSB1 bacterium]
MKETGIRDWYLSLFEEFERELNSGAPALGHMRRQAIRWFAENGFPSTRQEEWRFTNVSPISEIKFEAAEKPAALDPARILPYITGDDSARLVFVNGHIDRMSSTTAQLPHGLMLQSLQDALASNDAAAAAELARHARMDENGFVALNTAFINDGAYVHVAKDVAHARPLHLLFITTDAAEARMVQPRVLIIVEDNAQLSVIERYISLADSTYFANPVTEIVIGENANVTHYKIQQESRKAFHTARLQVVLKRDSSYTSHNYAFGGAIARTDMHVVLDGEGIDCTLNGLYLGGGVQLIDNHTVIEHRRPHCNSREFYKGILDERARAVFSGKIHVHKYAQKTDAMQSNQNLILSEEATIDTKPQLEIYADDVKCTHGATVGRIDEESIFYLCSRGIGKAMAKNLMMQAFAGQITDRIKDDALREHIAEIVLGHLHDGHLHR